MPKEKWVLYEKDTTGQYALKRLAKRGKSFTVAVLFDKVHEYSKRYEFVCNGAVTAILFKETAEVVDISNVLKEDIVQMPYL